MKRWIISLSLLFGSTISVHAGMIGMITSGSGVTPSTATTNYEFLECSRGDTWTVTETSVENIQPDTGTYSYFRVNVGTAPGGSASWAFTVRNNQANTPITCTITGAATSCTDLVHSSATVPTDTWDMSVTPSGGPAATSGIRWALKFTANNNNEYPLLEGNPAIQTVSATRGEPLQGEFSGAGTVALLLSVIPTSGTISNMYVLLDRSQVTNSTYTFFLNGASSALTCTVPGGQTSCNDTSHVIAVVPGNTGVYQAQTGTTGSRLTIGAIFDPTINGETPIMNTLSTLASATTAYRMATGGQPANAVESNAQSLLLTGTLKKMYAAASPPSGQSAQQWYDINNAISALTCTVFGAATTCNDTTDQISVSDDNLLDTKGAASATGSSAASSSAVLLISQTLPSAIPAFDGLSISGSKVSISGSKVSIQ